ANELSSAMVAVTLSALTSGPWVEDGGAVISRDASFAGVEVITIILGAPIDIGPLSLQMVTEPSPSTARLSRCAVSGSSRTLSIFVVEGTFFPPEVIRMNALELAQRTKDAEPVAALPAPDERRRLRKAAGVRAIDLARLVGVTPRALRYWEQGVNEP